MPLLRFCIAEAVAARREFSQGTKGQCGLLATTDSNGSRDQLCGLDTRREQGQEPKGLSSLFVSKLLWFVSLTALPPQIPPPPPSVHRDKAMHAKGTIEVREAGYQGEPGERKGSKCRSAPSACIGKTGMP